MTQTHIYTHTRLYTQIENISSRIYDNYWYEVITSGWLTIDEDAKMKYFQLFMQKEHISTKYQDIQRN